MAATPQNDWQAREANASHPFAKEHTVPTETPDKRLASLSATRMYPSHYTPSAADYRVGMAFEARDGAHTSGRGLRVTAGACGTWVIRFTNHEADLVAGAAVSFFAFNTQFSFKYQTDRPDGRDYATIETDSDAALALFPGKGAALANVAVVDGALRKGESFTLRLGDRRCGSVGSEVYWTTTHGEILVGVDAAGDGEFVGIKDGPLPIEIVAHPELKLLRILGPTVAAVGEEFALHVAAFDRNRNLIDTYTGRVALEAPDGLDGLPGAVEFDGQGDGVQIVERVRATKPGVYRIAAATEAGERFTSNPIVVEATPTRRVYWGDVHCHSWGDDSMYLMHLRTDKLDPLSRHRQGMRAGRFDFGCPGPMALPFGERAEIWQAHVDAAREADAPGRYVPFLSYEHHPPEGDRQVFFKPLDAPAPPLQYREPMAKLDAAYGGRDDVFLEVHIGGAAPVWEQYRPGRERMVEIASGFGNAEWLLQRALRLGYRPTLAGASDLHVGLMGGPRAVETFRGRFGYKFAMNQRDSGYGSGPVTAVVADALARDALWEAMRQGRTYATTGARIYLDLVCNGARAGETADVSAGASVSITCHACERIERVDLIAGDRCIHTWRPDALDFDEHVQIAAAPGECMYVRVRQADSEHAWSPLVWLEGGAPDAAAPYPLWNAHEPVDLAAVPANDAQEHLPALERYLETEEERGLFRGLTPVRVVRESMGAAALFFCHYGPRGLPMSIRWFFEFEIPKIRYDFGWRDFGMVDEFDASIA